MSADGHHVYLGLIDTAELELDEEGTRISLTIVDTPGFGDQIDNEERYREGQSRRWDAP